MENYVGNTDKFQVGAGYSSSIPVGHTVQSAVAPAGCWGPDPPTPPTPSYREQQELSKKQAAELCALFRSKLEGGRRSAAAAGGIQLATQQRTFVPSAAPAAPVWGVSDLAPMDAEPPTGPHNNGGKTFAQMQAEEERAARRAAAAAAKPAASARQPAAVPAMAATSARPMSAASDGASGSGNRPGSAAAGGMQSSQPPAIPAQPASSVVAAVRAAAAQAQPAAAAAMQPQQQQPTGTSGAAAPRGATPVAPHAPSLAAAAASTASRPGVEVLGEELSALKATLQPLILSMLDRKVGAGWVLVGPAVDLLCGK